MTSEGKEGQAPKLSVKTNQKSLIATRVLDKDVWQNFIHQTLIFQVQRFSTKTSRTRR